MGYDRTLVICRTGFRHQSAMRNRQLPKTWALMLNFVNVSMRDNTHIRESWILPRSPAGREVVALVAPFGIIH